MTMESVLLAIRTNMLIGGARIDLRYRARAAFPRACVRAMAVSQCPLSTPSACARHTPLRFAAHPTLTSLPSPTRAGNGPEYSEAEAREAFNRMMREHGWF